MRKLFCFVIITIILMTNSVFLYAADEQTEYTYTIDMFSWETKYSNGTGYRSAHEVKGTIRSAYKIVAYREISFSSTIVKFYFYESSGNIVYECNQFLQNMKNYVSWSGTCESGKTDLLGVFKQDDEYSLSNNLRGTCYWKEDDYMNPDTVGRFVTSIPVFNSSDEAKKFISGELTEKDAINYESDLCKVVYDLEVPQDLKITGFSGDEFNLDFAKIENINYKFKWSQTDPEHSKWTTQFYCYEDFKYRLEGFFTSIGEWMYKEDYYLFYDDTDTYRCYWNDYFKKLAEGYVKKEETFGDYDYEILCTKVFVRNAWYDSLEGIQHYSNWIKVDIDFTSGEITTSFVELGGSEVEKDEDTGSLVIPEDNIIVDSDYTGSDYNGLMIQSSTDLVGWIKNGFGLTGENGVIVLMQDTFSFIPAELWYVFLTGISMFVLIAVVKWVRG